MKISRDQLLTNDWQTLFTREPKTFFEAIVIKILWDKSTDSIDHEMLARQRFIFERWFKYYEINLRQELEKELGLVKTKATADYQAGYLAGRIHALQHLPIIQGVFGKSVDLREVTELLRQLKAQEPIGVTTDEQRATQA